MKRGLLILCLWLVTTGAALADRRVALVLGIEEYDLLRPLQNPVNDALAVEHLLEGLGFEVFLETDRDLRRMRRAVEDFREDAAGADVALLFFAGHGVVLEGENYLLPTDADATSADALRATGLPLAEVQAALAAVAPVTLMLLDACRNDPFAGAGGEGRSAVPLSDMAEVPAPGLGRMGRADGLLVAFAAAPNETAADGAGDNSPFTEALVRHFGTAGVEVRTALTLVQQDVYDRSRGAQLPYVESGVPELVFLTAAGDLPERDRLLIGMAGLTPDVRAEVEALAAARNMPLAPLFGAVIAGDLARLPYEQRQLRLTEAADGFEDFRSGLQGLASDDPEVADLRVQAEASLTLGLADEARALLARAVTIDAAALETLSDRVRSRSLSQAASHLLSAEVSATDLRRDLTLADLTAAVALFAQIEGPDLDRAARIDFTEALWELGDLHVTLGQTGAALQVYRQWKDVVQARLAESAGEIAWQRDMMIVTKKIATTLEAQGDLAGAEAELRRSVQIAEHMAGELPDEVLAQRDLMVTTNQLGLLLNTMGDLEGAEAAFAVGLAIAERFAQRFPNDFDWQNDLTFSFEYLATTLVQRGKLDEAIRLYTASLQMRQKLLVLLPDDTALQRWVAISYALRADALVQSGGAAAALTDYQAALDITQGLAARDPANTQLQRDTYLLQFKIGDIHRTNLDAERAFDAYAAGLAGCEALAALDPANVQWQLDLVTCHYLTATASSDRPAHLQSALDILERLAAEGRLPDTHRDWAEAIRAEAAAE